MVENVEYVIKGTVSFNEYSCAGCMTILHMINTKVKEMDRHEGLGHVHVICICRTLRFTSLPCIIMFDGSDPLRTVSHTHKNTILLMCT